MTRGMHIVKYFTTVYLYNDNMYDSILSSDVAL